MNTATLRADTDRETPTVDEAIAALKAELDRPPSQWWQGYEHGYRSGYHAALDAVKRRGDEREAVDAALEADLLDEAWTSAMGKGPAWADMVLGDLRCAA